MDNLTLNPFPYAVVLTHDVDHLSLRTHPWRSRVWPWFVKKSVLDNTAPYRPGELCASEFRQGLSLAIRLPLVKLGWMEDPWEASLDVILDVERSHGVRSTFFFIPYPRKAGNRSRDVAAPRGRQCFYNVADYASVLQRLHAGGWEVGVHGINAHIDAESPAAELDVFRRLLPARRRGACECIGSSHLNLYGRTW